MSVVSFSTTGVAATRNASINTAAGAGALAKFYTGALIADASVAPTGTLLATLTCAATFGVQTAGVSGGAQPYLTANAIASANGVATGTPGYCLITTSAGVGVVVLDVGTTGTSVIMTPDTITSGAPVSITSLVITG